MPSQSPQSLFFGRMAFSSVTPQHNPSTHSPLSDDGAAETSTTPCPVSMSTTPCGNPGSVPFGNFIAFADAEGELRSPLLDGISMQGQPAHRTASSSQTSTPFGAGATLNHRNSSLCDETVFQRFSVSSPVALITQPAVERVRQYQREPEAFTQPPPFTLGRRGTLAMPRASIADVSSPPVALYRLREATIDDVDGILALTNAIDMTNATSFVWPRDEMMDRIAHRDPLTIIAVHDETGVVAGCAGIDTLGMSKPLRVLSIGSRVTGCEANNEFDIPDQWCMCRGLLIHPDHQGAGLGSKLHRQRIETLVNVCPEVPCVVLSARGSSFDEAKVTLGPLLQHRRDSDVTPQFSKETLFQFTFHTSQGVVHLAHQREKDGWKFVGVDVSDGGPVWCTAMPLRDLVKIYPQSRRPTAVVVDDVLAALANKSG